MHWLVQDFGAGGCMPQVHILAQMQIAQHALFHQLDGSACAVYTDHTMTHHDTATADSWLSSCISILLQSMVMQRRKHMWWLLEAHNERWVYHVLTVPSLQFAYSVHTCSSHARFATSFLDTWWPQHKCPAYPMQAHPAMLPTWCKISKPC